MVYKTGYGHRNAIVNIPKLELFVKTIQKRLSDLNFEGKRLALDMLDITVWMDNENVDIIGTVDLEMSVIATMPLRGHIHNNVQRFSLKVATRLNRISLGMLGFFQVEAYFIYR